MGSVETKKRLLSFSISELNFPVAELNFPVAELNSTETKLNSTEAKLKNKMIKLNFMIVSLSSKKKQIFYIERMKKGAPRDAEHPSKWVKLKGNYYLTSTF